MKSARVLFAIAAALILVGVGLILLEPGPPEGECADDPLMTSGSMSDELDCPLSIESFEELMDYESSPFWFRISGLVVILIGIGFAVTGTVVALRGRKPGDTASGPESGADPPS